LAVIWKGFSGLRESVLEGFDEPGGQIVGKEFVVRGFGVHDLPSPVEVPRRDDLDPPRDDLDLFRHDGPPSPVPSLLPGITIHLSQDFNPPNTIYHAMLVSKATTTATATTRTLTSSLPLLKVAPDFLGAW
jgi:hypothetical protein